MIHTDTIVAPATAPGEAAVAIVRISGPAAWALAHRLVPGFRPTATPRLAHRGRLLTPDGVQDDVLVLPFRAPRSYTGEDLIEVHMHGSDVVVSAVVAALAALGARPARPGEFTQRAFENGKLDLTQAEAVGEMIAAKSQRAAQGAAARLAGTLSGRYRHIRQALLEVLVHLEATIDFPEEDVETLGYPRLLADVAELGAETERLTATFAQGRVERDGLRVAIAGRPNAGKSSLLNRLLGAERAIVTPVPGTTRDYLEETMWLAGAALQLIDTAGLRETSDPIETEGIRRTREKVGEADVVLYVLDAGAPWPAQELDAARELGRGRLVWVVNKIDLCPAPDLALLTEVAPTFPISVVRGDGIPELLTFLAERTAGSDRDTGVRVTSARQQRLLTHVARSLATTTSGLEAGASPELIVEDLREAVQAAGELTGDIVSDEVLGEIFSRFCIGK
jgi:tRNA modification GTPase